MDWKVNCSGAYELGDRAFHCWNTNGHGKVNMKEAGIIDPLKVTRSALQNAASIAGTILLTEAVVVDKPSDKKDEGIDPSMFGM